MPRGDRTGPQGMGPRTGRGAGYCAGYDSPGYANQGFGGGFGRGFGRGMFGRRTFGRRGRQNWFNAVGHPGAIPYGAYPGAYPPAPMTPEQEQDMLKSQEAWLQEQLEAVQGQLNKDQSKK